VEKGNQCHTTQQVHLQEAIRQAHQELQSSPNIRTSAAKTAEIFEALDHEAAKPVVDAVTIALEFSLVQVGMRRPDAIDVIAKECLAVGIWLGRRVHELMQGDAEFRSRAT
jgi:hypothetical protein